MSLRTDLLVESELKKAEEFWKNKEYKEALSIYMKLTKTNPKDPRVWYGLGVMHLDGLKTEKSIKLAYSYFKLAAEQGHLKAQLTCGVMRVKGLGIEADEKKAFGFFKLAAEQRDRRAQYNVAQMYHSGLGVKKDEKEAIRFYTLAAKNGYPHAQYNLGLMYHEAEGVEQDEKKAVELFTLAAEQKNEMAQFKLAMMYEKGCGVKRDLEKASQLYHDSASSGYGLAQSYLGCEYFKNNSKLIKQRDLKKAQYFFSQLAENIYTVDGISSLADLIPEDCDNAWLPPYFPFPVYQEGPTCGFYALSFCMRYALSESDFNHYARKEGEKYVGTATVKMSHTKDEDPEQKDKGEKKVSLRSMAKELKYTAFGEMYDIRGFDALTKKLNVPGGEIIHVGGDIKKEDYIKLLCDNLQKGSNLVVACDLSTTIRHFPGNSKGLGAHWMHLFGYYYDKDQCYFLATQYGKYYAINGDELFESNKQLPEKIPPAIYFKIKSPGAKKIESMVSADKDVPEGTVSRCSPITNFKHFQYGIFGIRAKNDSEIPRTDVVPLSSFPSGEKIKKWVKK